MIPREQANRNNIDFLRLILASIVALFHVFALTQIDAFSGFATYLSADFAVKAFFVISGMLVYQSYIYTSSTRRYFEKRARRIYPAYLTVVLVCAFGFFTFSSCAFPQYFAAGFLKYLGANLIFLNFLAPALPGVFQGHHETAVDGAFWTLKLEVLYYCFVPLMHRMFKKIGTGRGLALLFCLSYLWRLGFEILSRLGSTSPAHQYFFHKLAIQFPGQLSYFVAGAILLIYFDKFRPWIHWIAALTAILFVFDHFLGKGLVDVFWIPGVMFVFCFWRYFGNFAKYGDFSYGVYIVHWPILQTLIHFGLDKRPPAVFLAVSLPLIALSAILLWHLVEKRWLARSSHYRLSS